MSSDNSEGRVGKISAKPTDRADEQQQAQPSPPPSLAGVD